MIQVFKPKRRDVLRTATGLAAAAVVGGSLAGGQEVAAQRQTRGKGEITANIESIGEFAVLSFSWGLSNAGSADGSGGDASRVQTTDIVIVKTLDKSSPKLAEAVADGTRLQGVVINGVASGVGGSEPYEYKLIDVRITSYSVSGSSDGGAPVENISMNFEEISFATEGSEFTWDFGMNTTS